MQTKDFFFCLVDEADSILIDEARTPLIISRSVDAPAQKFATSQKIASVLEKGVHYTVRTNQAQGVRGAQSTNSVRHLAHGAQEAMSDSFFVTSGRLLCGVWDGEKKT